MIYLYTGEGGGKTTAAMGLALRALGHGKRVVIIQFMKGRFTGEMKSLMRFLKCDFKQFGRHGFVNLDKPSSYDKELAVKGLAYARKSLEKKPFLLILDEVNLACAAGLLRVKEVLDLLKKADCHVVLTGRRAPKPLIKAADFTTKHEDLKRKDVEAIPGLEY